MKRFLVPFFLLLLAALPLQAQQHTLPRHSFPVTEAAEGDEMRVIHVTDRLVNSPEGQAALQAYHEARAAGLLPRTRKGTAYAMDDTTFFNVLFNLNTTSTWVSRRFVLKEQNNVANIWVEVAELNNGNVTQDELDALSEGILNATPNGSLDPTKGFVENNLGIFGDHPDYDGDGLLDVLIYDIVEGDDQCCVLGFVTSTDINPGASSGQGNQGDFLYLDANEGTIALETLQSAGAHEHQHLIHFTYDTNEHTFVNEGLSHWAQVMNGYNSLTSAGYLNDPERYNASFLGTTDGLDERRRGALFTAYFAQLFGPEVAGEIARTQSTSGVDAYAEVLSTQGVSLDDLLFDFHTLNYFSALNTIFNVDARFSYEATEFFDVQATPSPLVDGRTTSGTTDTDVTLQPGGVVYLAWEKVEDFELTLDVNVASLLIPAARSRLRMRALVEPTRNNYEIIDLDPAAITHTFSGSYERIAIIAAHIRPEEAGTPIRYSAVWGSASAGFTVEQGIYDDGRSINGNFVLLGPGAEVSRFQVPANGILSRVLVAPYYLSQLDASTSGQKDFELVIYDDNNGEPGTELYTKAVVDITSPASVGCDADGTCDAFFSSIDLEDDAELLTNLPTPIYVGIRDTGTDNNDLVVGVSEYTVENTSYIFLSNTWAPLWDLTLVDNEGNVVADLNETTLLIRTEFLVPADMTPVETDGTLPAEVSLAQNYPNPFNPETTLAFTLPQAGPVRLSVYDVLGRRVAVVAEGQRLPGRHEVRFDAQGLAGGLYFYTLEAAGQQLTRPMMLLK